MKKLLLLISVITIEIIACYYAFYTLGEVMQIGLILVFCLNIIPLILYFLKLKTVSLIIFLLIAIIIVPNQISLTIKWFQLKNEAPAIISYIYQYKDLKKEFPENIIDYNFKNKKLLKHFRYSRNKSDFGLHYFVGTKGTTHFYYHSLGEWNYYPD